MEGEGADCRTGGGGRGGGGGMVGMADGVGGDMGGLEGVFCADILGYVSLRNYVVGILLH